MIKVAPCLHSAVRQSAYDTILALEVVSCLLLISVFFNTMPKTRRMAYTAQFKRDAIKLGDEVGNRKAAQQLCIESMARKWRAYRVPLSTANNSLKSFRGHKPRWPELEAELADWVEVQRAGGHGVSTVQVRLKAKQMAEAKGIQNFAGNPSWCFRFMRRNNLSMRTKTTLCQQVPADLEEKLGAFRAFTSEYFGRFHWSRLDHQYG